MLSIDWADLPQGNKIRASLEVSLNRFLHDLIPDTAALPWIVKPGVTWARGNGPLARFVPGLKEVMRPISDDFGRHVENKYSEKLQPRNIFHADVFNDKLEKICWTVPTPKHALECEFVKQSMLHDGLGKNKTTLSVWDVRPPSGVTSLGVMYDDVSETVITGPKQRYWQTILGKAKKFEAWVSEQGFTWKNIDARWDEVVKHLNAIYIPGVRLDRGAKKLRLLFAGHAVIYVSEIRVAHGIKTDMKQSPHYGYVVTRGEEFMDSISGDEKVISGDFDACDLHFDATGMKACWKAWQEVYELPESLMCALYAYNTFAPIAVWDCTGDEPKLILRNKSGINPSGGGAFVIIMNVFARAQVNFGVSKLLQVPLERMDAVSTGISFGDDHVLPRPTALLSDWVAIMRDLGQEVSGSEVWQGQFKFLRALYGKRYTRTPITFSRFRNACCPEDPGIMSRAPELNAIALRAQLLPFAVMKQSQASYKIVYEELSRILVPGMQLMLDEYPTDALLASSVEFGASEKDALFFAKRQYQVEDSAKFLG